MNTLARFVEVTKTYLGLFLLVCRFSFSFTLSKTLSAFLFLKTHQMKLKNSFALDSLSQQTHLQNVVYFFTQTFNAQTKFRKLSFN